MADNNNPKKTTPKINPLELFRESGQNAANIFNDEVIKPMIGDFREQLFYQRKKYSGEIKPGKALEMDDVYSGDATRKESSEKQLILERRMREEDRVFAERKTNELRIQIQAIHEEVIKLSQITPELAQEVKVAAFQAPVEPSAYELSFLQHIYEIIRKFRKKIEDAQVWLNEMNGRARKKNAWGANYGKHGAKYLLSGEHYLTRSAG